MLNNFFFFFSKGLAIYELMKYKEWRFFMSIWVGLSFYVAWKEKGKQAERKESHTVSLA